MTEIKNLRKVATRITKAIKEKQDIILYGDSDMDGATSVILLKEAINNLQGKISAIYFANREMEGYGISRKAISFLKDKAPALFITLDCGITNFQEVKLAKKAGFEVIIIDHHEVLDKLPEAEIIVDPKQKGDRYPFKQLANVGIVFKLAQILLKNKLSQSLKNSFLELAALGTLADMMPLEQDNKIIVEEGIKSLKNSWRPGVKVFFEEIELENYQSFSQKIFRFISILDFQDIKNQLPVSYRLLICSSPKEAKRILLTLMEKNQEKKRAIEKIKKEIEERISRDKKIIIFEGSSEGKWKEWNFICLGAVASILAKQYQKPAFLFIKIKNSEKSLGSVRSPKNYNVIDALKKCSKFLETYGGHPQAAGFRIKNKNLEKFERCLLANYKQIESE